MGFFDFLKRTSDEKADVSGVELTLDQMPTGCYVDYDLTTWKVTAANLYDWDGEFTREWQLESSSKTVFLELEVDDEAFWSMSESIPYKSLDKKVQNVLAETGDPPKTIVHEGVTYDQQTVSGGFFLRNGQEDKIAKPQELLVWDFESRDGSKFLSIEQWGENDFSASTGRAVKEYEFTNLTPSV